MMDFYDKLIEINMQLAESFSKLHSLKLFSSKKQFISCAKKLIFLANESKKDKILYNKLMDMAVLALSNSGYTSIELENNFASMMPYEFLKLVTCREQFATISKKFEPNDFQKEIDLIFTHAPFMTKFENSEKIRFLFEKFNMPYPSCLVYCVYKI